MGRRRALLQEVVQDGVTHRAREWQGAPTAGLGRDDRELIVLPVDVAKTKRPDLTAAKAVGGYEKEHGVVAPTSGPIPVDHAQQSLHLVPGQSARNIGEAISPSERHCVDQVCPSVAPQVQPSVEAREGRRHVVPRGVAQVRSALGG